MACKLINLLLQSSCVRYKKKGKFRPNEIGSILISPSHLLLQNFIINTLVSTSRRVSPKVKKSHEDTLNLLCASDLSTMKATSRLRSSNGRFHDTTHAAAKESGAMVDKRSREAKRGGGGGSVVFNLRRLAGFLISLDAAGTRFLHALPGASQPSLVPVS